MAKHDHVAGHYEHGQLLAAIRGGIEAVGKTPSTVTADALATPEDYREALEKAGFEITATRNRHGFAVDFFNEANRKMAKAGGPPPLGIHVHMGREAPAKIRHMVMNLVNGHIAPVEFIARKA